MKRMKKKEILVISTGLAPQVITEMLWWLAGRDERPRIVPDAIHVVTTRKGAEIIEEQVLGPEGKLAEFCREFGLPDLNDRLHVNLPEATNPEDADDARDVETNVGYANCVTRLLRELTDDPANRIRACLAGGRKAMSFYMGYAMSLFGDSDDELCHVLVSPEFENSREFWWKPKNPRMIQVGPKGQEQRRSTEEAEIDVAPIPFVRMRYLMREKSLDELHDFQELVTEANAGVERQRIVLTDSRLEVQFGDQAVTLPPKLYAFYRMVAEWCEKSNKGAGPDGIGPSHEGWLTMANMAKHDNLAVQRFLDIKDNLPQTRETNTRRRYEMKDEKDMKKEFNQMISKINRELRDNFDYIKSDRVRIHQETHGRNHPARFGLTVDPRQIEVISDWPGQ